MHLIGRKKGNYWNAQWNRDPSPASPIATPKCRMITPINTERPGSGHFSHWLSNFFRDTVIQGVTELGPSGLERASRKARRRRGWPNQSIRSWLLEKADNIRIGDPPLSHSHCSLMGREHSPGKSVVSVIINYSILLLWILKQYEKWYLNMHFQ